MFHHESEFRMAKHIKRNGLNEHHYPNYEISRKNDHHQITYVGERASRENESEEVYRASEVFEHPQGQP